MPTVMSQDYPQLALDDLVHIMSPSPAPQSPQDDTETVLESPSPTPLFESDIVRMREMVSEMRHVEPDARLTPREQELADMVLRLTATIRPDADQFLQQADMISALIRQRDLLLHQAEEQRLRWNAEKDGWARMAEALLVQQAKNRSNPERDEDYERLRVVDADNKGLRQRLSETQSRLQMLESELTRLKPLLLMQPLISLSSQPPPTPNPKTHYARRRRKDATTTEDEEHDPSEDEPLMDPLETPSHTSQSQATPRAKSRKPDAPSNVHLSTNAHKRKPNQKTTSRGLSADARVEHLLLAARKVGKQRAGIVSGMVRHLEEREQERRREDSATTGVAITPKTPKRHAPHAGYSLDSGYVYMNGQTQPGPGIQPVPLFFPAYPHHLLQTPSSSTTAPSVTSAQTPKQDARFTNPPTPLDSLLSAARSMMREGVDVEADEDEEVDVMSESPAGARGARSIDTLGSPVPKRRKVASRTDKLTASHDLSNRAANNASVSNVNASLTTDASLGRVRSALDVLADQAAAFSTQEHSVVLSQTKGKGKETATQPQESSSSTSKSRGRTKSRRQEAEVGTPSSAARTSRSGTPRSDLGENPTTFGSEALVDPGGGTSNAVVTLNTPSSRTLDSTEADCGATKVARSPHLSSRDVDDAADATPRQGLGVETMPSEDGRGGAIAQPSFVALLGEDGFCEVSSYAETIPTRGDDGLFPPTAPPRNKELVRVAEQDAVPASTPPAKRQRSPYVKWSKEEDDLLAQAVAKYGQKWDLVQKALPSRGYHQVRQRWLRKLGVFDSKPDLSSFQTAASFSSPSHGESAEPKGNPKLGLAPLSSERAFSGLVGKSPSMPS